MQTIDLEKIEKYWLPTGLLVSWGHLTIIQQLAEIGFQAEADQHKDGIVVEEGGIVRLVTLRGLHNIEFYPIPDEDRSIYNSVRPQN